MDNKARIGLFVGGLVLVGMVAYVMMPRSSAKTQEEATGPADSTDFAAAPATQPAATQPVVITDPFAAPAPATPATPGSAVASTGAGGMDASVTTLGQQPGQPQAATVQPADGNDAWARALDTGSAQTHSVAAGLSSHSSLLSDASTLTTPAGTSAGAGMGAGAGAGAGTAPKTYKVEPGDSPFTIAQKLLGDGKYASRIMAANPGVNARRLKAGQELTIPDINAREAVASAADTAPVSTASGSTSSASAKTYKVQAGDSLMKISSKLYGKSGLWKQIYAANKSKIGSDPTRLRAGMVLQLPGNVQ